WGCARSCPNATHGCARPPTVRSSRKVSRGTPVFDRGTMGVSGPPYWGLGSALWRTVACNPTTHKPLVSCRFDGGPEMNITSRPAAPAGWYQDPRGLPQLRFWNGTTWTNQVTTAERRADSG